jgi:hypothetical protein
VSFLENSKGFAIQPQTAQKLADALDARWMNCVAFELFSWLFNPSNRVRKPRSIPLHRFRSYCCPCTRVSSTK